MQTIAEFLPLCYIWPFPGEWMPLVVLTLEYLPSLRISVGALIIVVGGIMKFQSQQLARMTFQSFQTSSKFQLQTRGLKWQPMYRQDKCHQNTAEQDSKFRNTTYGVKYFKETKFV